MNYTVNKVGNTVAAAACGSPWWLPSLHDISTTAAEWLPILGAAYLVVQVTHFLWTKKWTRASDSGDE